MHYSQIPEKPFLPSVGGRIDQPTRIFFFEHSNGKVFSAQESEAWNIYARGNQVVGKERMKPKLIGTGDGQIFYKAVMESQRIGKTDFVQGQEMLKQGLADELEACRGKIILPKNQDKMGPGADFI